MISQEKCIPCTLKGIRALAEKYIVLDKIDEFMKKVELSFLNVPTHKASPYLYKIAYEMLQAETGIVDFYVVEKKKYNEFIHEIYDDLKDYVLKQDDPLLAAMKLSQGGNLIDFGAIKEEDLVDLENQLINYTKTSVDMELYEALKTEFRTKENLLYISDNCGEIVLDKLFIEMIQKEFPINITLSVRGNPIINDCTKEDIEKIGFSESIEIIDNGVAMPGTDLEEVSDDFLSVFKNADAIISKGQGNFETLPGCGYNVYYLFLAKCQELCDTYDFNLLQNMFVHESRVGLKII